MSYVNLDEILVFFKGYFCLNRLNGFTFGITKWFPR